MKPNRQKIIKWWNATSEGAEGFEPAEEERYKWEEIGLEGHKKAKVSDECS